MAVEIGFSPTSMRFKAVEKLRLRIGAVRSIRRSSELEGIGSTAATRADQDD